MFEPFQKVLIRNYDYQQWNAAFFSYNVKEGYVCTTGVWNQCIPYEGNEHLLGTTYSTDTDKPRPEFKFGDHVEVSDNSYDWYKAVYMDKATEAVTKNKIRCRHYRVLDTKGVIGLWEHCRKADW